MSEKTSSGSSGGIGFFGLLCIAFIVLKLCGVINWPWLWVLWPLWLPITAIIVFCVTLFVLYALSCMIMALIEALIEALIKYCKKYTKKNS